MANDLLKQINKIKSTISTNDQIVWACQASSKCYTNEINRLKDEEKRLTKDISKIDEQIQESKPLVGILEKCYEVQKETLEISLESLVTHRLYQKSIEENLIKYKRESENSIQEYSEHIEQCKTKLEQTNPLFKILQEKKIELKKSKIRCLDLQQRIKTRTKINEQKKQIHKKLFYADIVLFAEAWLNHKQYLEAIKEYEEVKQQERVLMIKLMELTEELRIKEKIGYVSKDTSILIQQSQKSKKFTEGTTTREKPSANTNPNVSEKPSANPFNDLESLLKENNFASNFGPSETMEKSYRNISNKTNHLPVDNAIPVKVKILENKTLKPPCVVQPVEVLSKEERSKAIEAKLQRVMQNFSRSMSRQNSQKIKKVDQKKDCGNTNNINKMKSFNETNRELTEEATKSQTGATQDLKNMNILSQETNMAMNLLSQDSVTNNSAEAKLRSFKYAPTDNFTVANKEAAEKLSDSEDKISPSQMDVDGHKDSDTEKQEIFRRESSAIRNTSLFNGFGRNTQFSMNLGVDTFGNAFNNGDKDLSYESSVFPLPGTNEIFKPTGNTLNFPQPFKINNNIGKETHPTNNIFKVPKSATANNFPSQCTPNNPKNNSQNPQSHIENDFFNMRGPQYDFGSNMTQISENPNESYEVAWSPPSTDFSNNSPMDTNPLMTFGQTNSGFGFSFK